MSTFMKAAGLILLAVILGLAIGKQWKEAALLLSVCACCMVLSAAMVYLKPVVELMEQLQNQAGLDPSMLEVLLKVVGIGLISEIAALICTDAGNASLGKAVQILASMVILWLSVPLFTELMKLVTQILGGI